MTLDELDALHAAAWPGPWTAETWEVECDPGWSAGGCPTGDDCDGSHDCETILAPEAYPDGQVVVQTSHADGRIRAPGLEQFAAANTAAIAALHNAWPDVSARLRAAEAALRGMLATHDQSHSEECNAWASRDEDVCKCDDGCAEPHCDCGSLDARNAARAALGEP